MPQGDYLPEGMLIGTERNKEHTRGSKNILKAMAKKTVLKSVLKYAPMKSDFVRAITANDETVKNTLSADMSDVDNAIPTYGSVIDESTGEILGETEPEE